MEPEDGETEDYSVALGLITDALRPLASGEERDEERARKAAAMVLDAVEDGLERVGKTDAAARERAKAARPAFEAKLAALILAAWRG